MFTEGKVSERAAVIGFLAPNLNVAASGADSVGLNTGPGDMSKFNRCRGRFAIGVKGTSATWNFRLQESADGSTAWTNVATEPGGATPLALTTKVQIANQFAELEVRADQLTKRYVRGQCDDANGTTASAVSIVLEGFDPRNPPVKTADNNTFLNTQIAAG